MEDEVTRLDGATVRDDFNSLETVIHYTRAAQSLGLWASERMLIGRLFPDRGARLLEAGCGAGRVTLALARLGYRDLTGFDFADEMIDQAQCLARQERAAGVRFLEADATRLRDCPSLEDSSFDGVLFLFNGLMQIPGRENRRTAMRELRRLCRTGAVILFTSHDRDADRNERAHWAAQAEVWSRGAQDPRLLEFGDRYFAHEHGRTFMHLPVRAEVLEDLEATGWAHEEDALRDELALESRAVRDFSDNCRFWVARKP